MRYIIHIGQSKTGTTSLQAFLAKNREALCLQGFLYPDVYVNNMPLNVVNHNGVAELLAGYPFYYRLTAEDCFEQFEEQLVAKVCDTIILSAESFFGIPQVWRVQDEKHFMRIHKKKIEALAHFIKGHDLRIIAYLRHQGDWFESAVSHIIRTEGLLEHHVYDDDEQLFGYLKPHMDYVRILDLWRSEFSLTAMKVLPFDRNSLKNQSIIDDFCAQTGINAEGLNTQLTKQNDGLDRRYVWLKKRLNKKSRSKAKERTIIELMGKLSDQIEDKKKYQIKPDVWEAVNKFCVPLNKELCQVYGMDVPNILTELKDSSWRGDITEEEKQDAVKSFNSAVYTPRAVLLYIRYGAGAFLRKYAPSVNAFLKTFIK